MIHKKLFNCILLDDEIPRTKYMWNLLIFCLPFPRSESILRHIASWTKRKLGILKEKHYSIHIFCIFSLYSLPKIPAVIFKLLMYLDYFYICYCCLITVVPISPPLLSSALPTPHPLWFSMIALLGKVALVVGPCFLSS